MLNWDSYFRIPVNLYFTPKSDDEVNFNIVCAIKKKIEPLRLNVKVIILITKVSYYLKSMEIQKIIIINRYFVIG